MHSPARPHEGSIPRLGRTAPMCEDRTRILAMVLDLHNPGFAGVGRRRGRSNDRSGSLRRSCHPASLTMIASADANTPDILMVSGVAGAPLRRRRSTACNRLPRTSFIPC